MNPKAVSLMAIIVLGSLALLPMLDTNGAEEENMAKWTFMVYLDSDNNLESAGVEDMNEMEMIGSTDEVNIIVQMDRWETEESDDDTSNGDWKGCKRFRVEKDGDTSIINSPELMDLGEVNMGDPDVLIDFARWSMDNYPAENYGMVLWDHGGAFYGICWDDTVPGSNEADTINMTEMKYAAREIYLHRGAEKLEFWGFDACLMAQVAVLYQLKDFVEVAVASGYNEPGDGWPYEDFLADLTMTPTMDGAELGKSIAKWYVESYSNSEGDPDDSPAITMAVFDLTKFNDLALVLDKFSVEMAFGARRFSPHIWGARESCTSYDMINIGPFDFTKYSMYDVYDFTEKLEIRLMAVNPINSPLISLCRDVREAIDSITIRLEKHLYNPTTNVHGLSMYFPNKEDIYVDANKLPTTYDGDIYEQTDFAREHLWDEFLLAYYRWENLDDSPPVVNMGGPQYNYTYGGSEEFANIWGEAYDREELLKVEIRVDWGEWGVMPGISGQGKTQWIYSVDLRELEPGQHLIEVRAWDSLGDTQPGHVTTPVSTMINIGERSSEKSDGPLIPSSIINGAIMLLIAAGLALGVVLFMKKND